MVVYFLDGYSFRSLRSVRDHLWMSYTETEALKFFSYDRQELICRNHYNHDKLVSQIFYLVYFCPKRKKFIIRADY